MSIFLRITVSIKSNLFKVKRKWICFNKIYFIGNNKNTIPVEKWTNSKFPKINQLQLDRIGMENFLWPKNLNYSLLGNYYSSNFQYIKIDIIKCIGTNSNGVAWKSESEINSYIDKMNLNVLMSSAYYRSIPLFIFVHLNIHPNK